LSGFVFIPSSASQAKKGAKKRGQKTHSEAVKKGAKKHPLCDLSFFKTLGVVLSCLCFAEQKRGQKNSLGFAN
jgi:hypothetical protein